MDKDTQIKALLTGKGFEFATAALGVSHMAGSSYADVFTVTRADIDAYVSEHGIPMDSVTTDGSPREGLHFVRDGDLWQIYWLERGQRYDEQTFTDERCAKEALLNWLLQITGTGLNFAR